jgi:TPR repeat protein
VPQDYAEVSPTPSQISGSCTRKATACRRTMPRQRSSTGKPPIKVSPSRRNLGAMYAQGQGVPQDYAEAVKWFRTAAVQPCEGLR